MQLHMGMQHMAFQRISFQTPDFVSLQSGYRDKSAVPRNRNSRMASCKNDRSTLHCAMQALYSYELPSVTSKTPNQSPKNLYADHKLKPRTGNYTIFNIDLFPPLRWEFIDHCRVLVSSVLHIFTRG